ncbi:unnamed protein product [Sphacelaria rigidula]
MDETLLFAKSLMEVESFRLRQRKRLKEVIFQELGWDKLPPALCEESMTSKSSRVRKMCYKFPAGAESIVRANGLNAAEFNRLSAKSKNNLLYRWRVWRSIKELERTK